jgi:hypothetical protein
MCWLERTDRLSFFFGGGSIFASDALVASLAVSSASATPVLVGSMRKVLIHRTIYLLISKLFRNPFREDLLSFLFFFLPQLGIVQELRPTGARDIWARFLALVGVVPPTETFLAFRRGRGTGIGCGGGERRELGHGEHNFGAMDR